MDRLWNFSSIVRGRHLRIVFVGHNSGSGMSEPHWTRPKPLWSVRRIAALSAALTLASSLLRQLSQPLVAQESGPRFWPPAASALSHRELGCPPHAPAVGSGVARSSDSSCRRYSQGAAKVRHTPRNISARSPVVIISSKIKSPAPGRMAGHRARFSYDDLAEFI